MLAKLDIIIRVKNKKKVQLEYFSSIPDLDRWRWPNLSTQNIKFKIRISKFDFQNLIFQNSTFQTIISKMLTKFKFWHLSVQAKDNQNIDPAMHNFAISFRLHSFPLFDTKCWKIMHCRVYVLIVFCLEWQMSKF